MREWETATTARSPARPVPGGRQLSDGKTPALPFLVDRSVDPFREEFTAIAACLFLLFALQSTMLKMEDASVTRVLQWSSLPMPSPVHTHEQVTALYLLYHPSFIIITLVLARYRVQHTGHTGCASHQSFDQRTVSTICIYKIVL